MARLICEGRDVASLCLAETVGQRTRGLLGRDGIEGAVLLTPARSVHTLGMRFAIDVAHLDANLEVLRISTMGTNRVGRVVWRSRHVLEAPAGALAQWGIGVGSRLEMAA